MLNFLGINPKPVIACNLRDFADFRPRVVGGLRVVNGKRAGLEPVENFGAFLGTQKSQAIFKNVAIRFTQVRQHLVPWIGHPNIRRYRMLWLPESRRHPPSRKRRVPGRPAEHRQAPTVMYAACKALCDFETSILPFERHAFAPGPLGVSATLGH
jgi:hypothetical protein